MAELFTVETLLEGQFVIDLSVIILTSILHVLLTSWMFKLTEGRPSSNVHHTGIYSALVHGYV